MLWWQVVIITISVILIIATVLNRDVIKWLINLVKEYKISQNTKIDKEFFNKKWVIIFICLILIGLIFSDYKLGGYGFQEKSLLESKSVWDILAAIGTLVAAYAAISAAKEAKGISIQQISRETDTKTMEYCSNNFDNYRKNDLNFPDKNILIIDMLEIRLKDSNADIRYKIIIELQKWTETAINNLNIYPGVSSIPIRQIERFTDDCIKLQKEEKNILIKLTSNVMKLKKELENFQKKVNQNFEQIVTRNSNAMKILMDIDSDVLNSFYFHQFPKMHSDWITKNIKNKEELSVIQNEWLDAINNTHYVNLKKILIRFVDENKKWNEQMELDFKALESMINSKIFDMTLINKGFLNKDVYFNLMSPVVKKEISIVENTLLQDSAPYKSSNINSLLSEAFEMRKYRDWMEAGKTYIDC